MNIALFAVIAAPVINVPGLHAPGLHAPGLHAPGLHAPASPSVDPDRFLGCIVAVEGNKPSLPGGIFGLSAATWRQHSHLPYRYAALYVHARYVAEKHLRWLEKSLQAEGIDPTPYRLAVLWRHGFEGGKALLNDPRTGYGERVKSLYNSSHKFPL